MDVLKNSKEINSVATLIFSIIPDGCGVTLGGSRGYNVNDKLSDVELYFYTKGNIPSVERITNCLNSIGAKHKRSSEFLWNQAPWGPHSFFEVYGLTFEVGYRNVSEIETQMAEYLAGDVAPKLDCHDLGMGYMRSGLLSSIQNEKVLISLDNSIEKLKEKALSFPTSLKKALEQEYLVNAKKLLDGKLLSAALRNEIFFYEIIGSKVVRDLMVIAFSTANLHFPGDKWNEKLLLRGKWYRSEDFIIKLKEYYHMENLTTKDLLKKRKLLLESYQMLVSELK